jgi:hypothetical protein
MSFCQEIGGNLFFLDFETADSGESRQKLTGGRLLSREWFLQDSACRMTWLVFYFRLTLDWDPKKFGEDTSIIPAGPGFE